MNLLRSIAIGVWMTAVLVGAGITMIFMLAMLGP
jgi:hypothetical protein